MPLRPRRPVRTVNASTHQWMLFLRLFRELHGRQRIAVPPTTEREERRHLKTLVTRLSALDLSLEDYLREFLGQDDAYLDERDYPLRQAVRADMWVILVKRLQDAGVERDRELSQHGTGAVTGECYQPPAAARIMEADARARARAERLRHCTCGHNAVRCRVHFPDETGITS